ncbi:hypothetical protein HYZ98_00340 [Candidatus Peregrinibacteria bacterium]|nr:hypothetical protein [Candidatus Peregrinibacteria bacterium]
MKIDKYGIDTDDLPVLTLNEVREQVRSGQERVIWWWIQATTDMTRKNILNTLREFTEREFIVMDNNKNPIARLKEPTPPPFADVLSPVWAGCAKSMHDIRNRSNLLLQHAEQHETDISFFISTCLLDIERVIQHARNQLEVTLYRQYIGDIVMDEEQIDMYMHYAQNAFLSPEYALYVLEQSFRILMQRKQQGNSSSMRQLPDVDECQGGEEDI